jgi:hypothetical protein
MYKAPDSEFLADELLHPESVVINLDADDPSDEIAYAGPAEPHDTLAHILLTEEQAAGSLLAVAAGGMAAGYYVRSRLAKRRGETDTEQAAQAEADIPAERSLSHKGTTLVLKKMFATVNVVEAEAGEEDMKVAISGKTGRLEPIELQAQGDQLIASGPSQKNYLYMSKGIDSLALRWITRFVKKVTRRGFNIVDDSDRLHVTAAVPAGTNLVLNEIDGPVTAKGSFGDADVRVAYDSKISLGSVQDLQANTGSYAKLRVDSVDGRVGLHAGYESKTDISRGTIIQFGGSLASYAKLDVHADASDVNLNAGYESTATMARASGPVRLSTNSYAQVHVNDGKATKLTMKTGYESKIDYGGSAESASVGTSSYAKATIGSAKDLGVNAGYESSLQVQSGDVNHANITTNSYAKVWVGGIIHAGSVNAGYESSVRARGFGRDVTIRKASYAKVGI